MNGFSYVISRDYGFAPNPFGEYCTLATCKPLIRKCANIEDLVFGISPKRNGNNLIYAMRIDEKLSFNQYWEDSRFQYKKPVLNGSIAQMMGDNIYFYNKKVHQWLQADSHHSNDNGEINDRNVDKDTQADFVLISSHFYYFGKEPVILPPHLKYKTIVGRSHRCLSGSDSLLIWQWLEGTYEPGIYAEPMFFKKFKEI